MSHHSPWDLQPSPCVPGLSNSHLHRYNLISHLGWHSSKSVDSCRSWSSCPLWNWSRFTIALGHCKSLALGFLVWISNPEQSAYLGGDSEWSNAAGQWCSMVLGSQAAGPWAGCLLDISFLVCHVEHTTACLMGETTVRPFIWTYHNTRRIVITQKVMAYRE